jgi:NAD(P)H-hydrate repair Nnr-like enzyme with NAD(P)H-hydrate epimerase domain
MDIEFLKESPSGETPEGNYCLIVDALFGFSFKPPVRPEFQNMMNFLKKTQVPICSIDIPSGTAVYKKNSLTLFFGRKFLILSFLFLNVFFLVNFVKR